MKFFLAVDLKYQVEHLFRYPEIETMLYAFYHRDRNMNVDVNDIRDVHDGILQKNVNSTNCNTVLTFNFFLDGAALRRRSVESF